MASIHPGILVLLKLDSYNSLTAQVIACWFFNHRTLRSSHENSYSELGHICIYLCWADQGEKWIMQLGAENTKRILEQKCIQLTATTTTKTWGHMISQDSSFIRKRLYMSQPMKVAVKKRAFWVSEHRSWSHTDWVPHPMPFLIVWPHTTQFPSLRLSFWLCKMGRKKNHVCICMCEYVDTHITSAQHIQ